MKLSELSDHDLSQIVKAFRYFDRKNSGFIDVKHFGTAIRLLKLIPTEAEIKKFIEKCGEKKTGKISFETFCLGVCRFWIGSLQDLHRELWQSFLVFDKQFKGVLHPSEMKRILTVYGLEPVPEKEATKVIKRYTNKNTNMIEYGYLIRSWLR